MLGDFFDRIGDLFSDGGNGHYHEGHNNIVSGMEHSDFDLSMYSADEIKEAMRAAMDADNDHAHSAGHGGHESAV